MALLDLLTKKLGRPTSILLHEKLASDVFLESKFYVAQLTQAGVAAPTANVIHSSLVGAAPVLAYVGVGEYTLTHADFVKAQTVHFISATDHAGTLSDTVSAVQAGDGVITIKTGVVETAVLADALLSGTSILVIVMP